MEKCKVMIVGVGGQGTLLASRVLGRIILRHGYDVKVSEVHGMSQRGGSVVTYVCWGKKTYSPVICEGEADFIVSFELLEAARWAQFLKKDGILITGTQTIDPMPVITGAAEYPENIPETLKKAGIRTETLDAISIAESVGTVKAVNMVLMGKLSRHFDLPESEWLETIAEVVPEKFISLNQAAFIAGRKEE